MMMVQLEAEAAVEAGLGPTGVQVDVDLGMAQSSATSVTGNLGLQGDYHQIFPPFL